jgi:hypothetical protein
MNFLKRDSKIGPSRNAIRGRKALAISMPAMLLLCVVSIPVMRGSPIDVPSISAGLGTCSADFTVLDTASKPIYNAKVHVKVQYGFMSKRNTDLEVGTNGDGKARVEGLPNKLKKPPLQYLVQSGDLTKTVTQDPATDCHSQFNVTLGK